MKVLILFLVLAISTQPLQAGFCDMDLEKNQKTTHHMDESDGAGGHDCCDAEDTESPEGCADGMNCGMCFLSASPLPSTMRFTPDWEQGTFAGFSSTLVLPSHSSPPFRPPIS